VDTVAESHSRHGVLVAAAKPQRSAKHGTQGSQAAAAKPESGQSPTKPDATQGNPGAAPKPVETAKTAESLTGVAKEISGLATKIQTLQDAVGQVAGNVGVEVDRKIEARLATVVDAVRQEVTPLKTRFSGLEDRILAIEKSLSRTARKEDVAIVILHTKALDARLLSPVLEEIFLADGYRTLFNNYRLGLFLAADGQYLCTPVDFQPDTTKPVKREHLDFQAPNFSSAEIAKDLDPGAFLKSSPGTMRRLVLVASLAATPPPLQDQKWRNIQCYVILIDDTGKGIEAQNEVVARWTQFCQRKDAPRGEATLVSYVREQATPADPKAKTTPADPKAKTTPADPKAKTTPADPKAKTTPADPKAKTTPPDADVKPSTLPLKAAQEFGTKLRWYIRPI
jgi:hypothetical protein